MLSLIFSWATPKGYKGYKLYDLLHHKLLISRDVIFHENTFPFKDKLDLGLPPQSSIVDVLPNFTHSPTVIDDPPPSETPIAPTSESSIIPEQTVDRPPSPTPTPSTDQSEQVPSPIAPDPLQLLSGDLLSLITPLLEGL